MPRGVRDKLDLLAADFWNAAQHVANRAIEDAERGAAARVAVAEEQADEMAEQVDLLEARVVALTATIVEKDETIVRLRQAEDSAKVRMAANASKVAALQAQLRSTAAHTKKRDIEFEELCRRLDAAFKKAS